MFSLHTIFTACSYLSQTQAVIWSYSQAIWGCSFYKRCHPK